MPKRTVCLNWEADWASRSIWQVLRQFINEPESPDTYDNADTFATWMVFVIYDLLVKGAACIKFPETSENPCTVFGRQTARAPGAAHQTCPAVIHCPTTR